MYKHTHTHTHKASDTDTDTHNEHIVDRSVTTKHSQAKRTGKQMKNSNLDSVLTTLIQEDIAFHFSFPNGIMKDTGAL